MSIPSFDNPCSTISRASLAGYELQTMLDKEIIYLKRSPKIWHEVEDESLCIGEELDDSLSNKTKSSHSKSSSGKKSANENGRNEIILLSNPQSKSEIKILKKRLTSLHIAESSSYIFPTKAPVSSSTSRMLDWFMSCCWRCSPGCQQLPTLNM
ncbi:hypothetical protein QE152_g945 [Popillia japonica]|uniref:Uncharacterized protein n=1 Tax=Popillia japonica TaxID=7064 RepID=A0AAW1N8F3_POPJA